MPPGVTYNRNVGLFPKIAGPFATLFGGRADPRLDPEQNSNAARDAVLMAGLQTLQSASQPGASAVGSIADGAVAGQQVGRQLRGEAVQQNQRQDLAQLAAGGIDIPTARRMLVSALAAGDTESAKYITAVLTSMQAQQPGPPNLQRVETVDPRTGEPVIAAFNPATGQVDYSNAVPAPADPQVYERTFRLEEAPGKEGLYGVIRATGETVRIGDAPTSGSRGGVQGAMMRGLGNAARRANEALEPLDDELSGALINIARRAGDTTFGDITRWLANASSDGRAGLALTAGLNFINPAVRFLSGAQMNENEASRYIVALLPVTYDTPEIRSFKREMRQSLIDAMTTTGGSGDEWLESRDPADHERVVELLYRTPGGNPFIRGEGN